VRERPVSDPPTNADDDLSAAFLGPPPPRLLPRARPALPTRVVSDHLLLLRALPSLARSGLPSCRTYFTVHGLWPNYENGKWPAFCNSSYPFNEDEIEDILPTMEEVSEPRPAGPARESSHHFRGRARAPSPLAPRPRPPL